MASFYFPLVFNPHLFLFLFLFSCSPSVLACYTSVFSFGDSLIDTGNRLYMDNTSLTGRFPYGMTFFHRPTGRSSDGRVALDFIAEALRIPFLPSYLPSRSDSQKLRHGTNFAVAGATALPTDFFIEQKSQELTMNISLGDQIEWFLHMLPSLCGSAAVCGNSLRETLFLVGEIGVNDYFTTFRRGWKLEEIRTLVPQVIGTITWAVDNLIEHGAMTLVVPGIFPMGCMSVFLTLGESSRKEDYEEKTGCLKHWNELSHYHNRLLKIELNRLQEKHSDATIAYSDYYNAVWQVFRCPPKFGFSSERALLACCGGGGRYNYNDSARCGENGAKACSDPSLYWSWDGAHPTEGGHRLIADAVISQLHACTPTSVPYSSLNRDL